MCGSLGMAAVRNGEKRQRSDGGVASYTIADSELSIAELCIEAVRCRGVGSSGGQKRAGARVHTSVRRW